MNICICDDEKIYCDQLNNALKDYFNKKFIVVNIYTFNTIKEFLITKIQFNFIFMDIELSDGNGLDTIIETKSYNNSYIFYFTSHEEDAIKGYRSKAFRFLTKPLIIADLVESLDAALKDYYVLKTIAVSTSANNLVFKISRIIYVEANNKLIGIRTIDDFNITRETMESMLKKLNTSQFYSPHRSYIINFDYVKLYNNRYITMENGEKIPISRLRKKNL